MAPEDSSTTVLSSGTPQGDRGFTPAGGQEFPNSIVGASLLWKNAQKKAKKKQTSERINRIIPIRSPRAVVVV